MDRIIFEGTPQQIEELRKLVKVNAIFGEGDLDLLRESQNYQLDNLWHIADVQDNYQCSDDEAMGILESALTNEATMEQIWEAIDYEAEEIGLEKK